MAPPSEQDEHPGWGPAARDEPLRASAPAVLDLALNADWVAASIARDRVGRWLHALRWPAGQIDELVLAVSEAVSNSVEHGYGVEADAVGHQEVVEIDGRVVAEADGFRRVEFVVRDRGRWREPAANTGTRGHGMLIMRTCSDEFVVDGTAHGTTVVLRSRPVPAPL